MIARLLISLAFVSCSWTTAKACSPVIPMAVTQNSYEMRVEPYLTRMHRNMVDRADHIAIGKFKFSDRKQMHRLSVSKTIKRPMDQKRKKRVAITFKHIDKLGINYRREAPLANKADVLAGQFIPTARDYGISGAKFNPSGSCGTDLELNPDVEYLVFANKDFEITSMVIVSERTRVFQTAVENIVQDPDESFGISFSLKQTMERGNAVKLLTTLNCSPKPTYKILKSSTNGQKRNIFVSDPIMVFENNLRQPLYSLSKADLEHATNLGQERGLYKNAPALETCAVGQKFLVLGQFLSESRKPHSGQFITEKNGYFDLTETVFEHYVTPELISSDQVMELLEDLNP